MKTILTKQQIAVLKAVGSDRKLTEAFYLTGGTPLAVFYLHHRYSEDLDFFSEQEIDPMALSVFFKKNQKGLGIKKMDIQQSFNRHLFFLQMKDSTVIKTEFTFFPFPRIEKGSMHYGLEVDSLLDIAVNKLFTIYQRTKARDYIDLFMICQKEQYSIEELVKKAKIKFDFHIDPIQLGTQFLKSKEATDYPRMIGKVPSKVWQQFFFNEAKRLKNNIFE